MMKEHLCSLSKNSAVYRSKNYDVLKISDYGIPMGSGSTLSKSIGVLPLTLINAVLCP